MRTDEDGEPCPETSGEYYDITLALFGEKMGAKALEFLDQKIKEQGRDEKVIASDSQMRMLLFSMLDYGER